MIRANHLTEPTKPTVPCRICGDISDCLHFGVSSCRACAAFFRRWLRSKRKFVCRNNERCEIKSTLRFLCRKCRLDKCLKLGMKVADERNRYSRSPSPSPSEPKAALSEFGCERIPTLLNRITDNYRKLRERRAKIEKSINARYGRGYADLVPSSMPQWSEALRENMPLTHNFVKETFDEFSELSLEEQAIAFQEFYIMIWGMEPPFRSYKTCPERSRTLAILTDTTFTDMNRLDLLFPVPTDEMVRKAVIEVTKSAMSYGRQIQLRHMISMQMTDEEFSALLGFALFNADNDRCTENMEIIFKRARTRIYDDLQLYYRLHGYDYFNRLGELLYIQSTFLKQRSLFLEDSVIFELFHAYYLNGNLVEDLMSSKFLLAQQTCSSATSS